MYKQTMDYFKCIFFISISLSITNAFESDHYVLEKILERIDALEKNDVVQKREIASLKTEVKDIKEQFNRRENELLTEIESLTKKLKDGHSGDIDDDEMTATEELADAATSDGEDSSTGRFLRREPSMNRIYKRQQTDRRFVVENEVAFFATLTQHHVNNLGKSQVIVFDKLQTNVGQAYSPGHGVFTAPVSGIYVIHVSLTSSSAHNSDSHFYAEVDVNGHSVASLYMRPYSQSAQMIVVSLSAGGEVSIKNDVLGDSIYGNGWSSFSGFLLYETTQSPVIGK